MTMMLFSKIRQRKTCPRLAGGSRPAGGLLVPTPKRGWRRGSNERGAAVVEFALILPLLLVILLGILDFGLYFYNDLQLVHVARDAARYASVGDVANANAAIGKASLVSTTITSLSIDPGTTGTTATVTLTASYSFLTPLPALLGIGRTKSITATAYMRRE
jgi:Flp pilus assembly protein TadG